MTAALKMNSALFISSTRTCCLLLTQARRLTASSSSLMVMAPRYIASWVVRMAPSWPEVSKYLTWQWVDTRRTGGPDQGTGCHNKDLTGIRELWVVKTLKLASQIVTLFLEARATWDLSGDQQTLLSSGNLLE